MPLEWQLNHFFKQLNSINPKIQIIMEIEQEKIFNYLDLPISHKSNKFFFRKSNYRKEKYTNSIILSDPSHHYSTTLAALNSMAFRLGS